MNVIHYTGSMRRGGLERQIATIYKYTKDIDNIKILCNHRAKDTYIEEYGMSADILYIEKNSFWGRVYEVRKIIKENNTDIIWAWNSIPATILWVLTLATKIKWVNASVRHGIVNFKNKSQLWRCIILHLSKNIVANSQAGLCANKLKRGNILYNGLDDKFFEKEKSGADKFKSNIGIRDKDVVFISVANLVPYKDYITVLYALAFLKNNSSSFFKYLIIGEGQERGKIENKIQELSLNDNVILLGRRNDINELLKLGDIFIHSSKGEGISNAIIEAMASKLPIIASRVGGTPEIVTNDCGFLFEYQNIKELSRYITKLYEDIDLRIKMGCASYDRVSRLFTADKMIDTYNKINSKIMNDE